MSETRIVHCRKLGKDLPGLPKPPYKNELGKKIYDEVSKEAWDQWLKDSVKYINTYRLDLASPEGQKFMLKQASIYFGFEEGNLADTAYVPAPAGGSSDEKK
jgi:Fe-S cluster biosynthesis and repair protein YggX